MLPRSALCSEGRSCHVDSSGGIINQHGCHSKAPRNATSRDDEISIEWESARLCASESSRDDDLTHLSLVMKQQFENFVQRIEGKICSYHQDVLHLAIEMREANHELATEVKSLDGRLFNNAAPFAEDFEDFKVGRSSAVKDPLERASKVVVPKECRQCESDDTPFWSQIAIDEPEDVVQEIYRPTTDFKSTMTVKKNQYDNDHMAADGAKQGPIASQKKDERAVGNHASLDVVNEDLDDDHSERHEEDSGQHEGDCSPKLGDKRYSMDFDMVNLFDSEDTVGTHRKKSFLEMFKDYLMGTGFDMVIGLFIMANAIVMAIELEYSGSVIAPALGLPKDTEVWPAADEAFFGLNHVFCMIFLMEFILRVYSWRLKFFKSPANCVDAAIVWISVVDLYIMQPMGIPLPNVAFLRLLRIAKLLKALNIIKQLRPFRHLRVLIGACIASTGALMWSIVFLMFVHFMFAIFMTQMLHGFLQDETAELEVQVQVYTYFGTVSRSLLTMWEITLTTGAWAKIGRLLIYEVDRVYTIFFVSYVYLFAFGAMKVISALFLKETLAAANNDQDMIIDEKVKHRNRVVNMARNLFHKIDTRHDNEISLDEMKVFMSNPAGAQWFYMLDIEAEELHELFRLLDENGDGHIDFDSFMHGINRIQGGARSLDVVELQASSRAAFAEITQILQFTKGIATELEEAKDSIHKLENVSNLARRA